MTGKTHADTPTRDCVPIEEMAAVLEAPAEDPRRIHVDACPRCRALSREFLAFVGGADPEPGQNDASAQRILRQRLAGEIYGERPQRSFSLLKWFRGGVRTPVWVGAAAVVVLVISVSVLRRSPQEEAPLLRGSTEISRGTFQGEATAIVQHRSGGRAVEFRWSAQDGADAYRIELYAADLTPLGKLDTGGETTWSWTPPETVSLETTPLLWRVVILQQGDEIARSRIRTLGPTER